jgi:hypothetical protein
MSVPTTENITESYSQLIKTSEMYNVYTEELLEFLGDELKVSPASTMKSMFNAYPGGLMEHILKTTKYAVKINKQLPEEIRVDVSSLVKVCLLHQLGKVYLYKLCEDQWQRDNRGKMYDYNEDIVSMRIGERSAYYSLKYGVDLTQEEYQSILNYDKSDDDKQAKWHSSTLSIVLKQANELAITEEKLMNND